MDDELKPCPFCGQPAELIYRDTARCSNGDCIVGYIDASVEEWNNRPHELELIETIKSLETRLDIANHLGHSVAPWNGFPHCGRGQ
jgi:hypothetical protein